jgi:uncharacterized delta-60 repeat protein
VSRARKTPRRVRLIAGLTALGAGALASVALASAGQPGAVDTTFANHGIASFGSGSAAQISFIAAEAVQPDGKVVMVGPTKPDQSGNTQMGVVRLNRDGSLDTTFGAGTGAVLIDFGSGHSATATAVALQSNGGIVVAGAALVGTDQIGVARLTASGALDPTFNPTGVTPGETTVDTADTAQSPPDTVGVAVQPADQKIVVVGTRSLVTGSAFQVSRLTTSGQPDTSFNGTGTVTTQIGSSSTESSAAVVAVQLNGRIVVGGNGTTNTGSRDFQVARYTSGGTLDTSFNASGSQPGTEDIPMGGEDPNVGAAVQAIAIQPRDQKEQLICRDVGLAHRFLRLADSAFYARRARVRSIRDALARLGADAVRRWALALALAGLTDTSSETARALLGVALHRARVCELLARQELAADPDAAFTVGLLSVLPGLIDRPMEELVAELPLDYRLARALMDHLGAEGSLLAAMIAYEDGQRENADGRPCSPQSPESTPNRSSGPTTTPRWGSRGPQNAAQHTDSSRGPRRRRLARSSPLQASPCALGLRDHRRCDSQPVT